LLFYATRLNDLLSGGKLSTKRLHLITTLACTLLCGPAPLSQAAKPPNLIWQQSGASRANIASAGEDYLIAWADADTAQIRASRLSVDGSVRDTFTVTTNSIQRGPSIAVSGSNYLVGWTAEGKLSWRVVHPDGSMGSVYTVPPFVIIGPRNAGLFALAGNSTGFIVRWMDLVEGRTPTLMGGNLNSEGDSGGNFYLVSFSADGETLATGASRTQFLTVWNQLDDETNTTTTLTGTVGAWYASKHFAIRHSKTAQQPSVAWNGASFAVTWIDEEQDHTRLSSALVTRHGRVIAGDSLVRTKERFEHPLMIRVGPRTILSWTEHLPYESEFVGKLFDARLRPLSFPHRLWNSFDDLDYGAMSFASRGQGVAILQFTNHVNPTLAAFSLNARLRPD
jgi:hypothetical protein